MKLHESGEKYLENILILQRQAGKIRSIDLAKAMDISRPSISRAVHILEKHGLLTLGDDGYITLSETGLAYAEKILHKHLVLLKFFLFLGASREQATSDACNIEHKISSAAVTLIERHLQHNSVDLNETENPAGESSEEHLANACIFQYNAQAVNCKSEEVCPFYRLAVANLQSLSKDEKSDLQNINWNDKAQLTQIALQEADNLSKNQEIKR